jgi:uncharacterized membrane protein
MKPKPWLTRTLWTLTYFLVLIGVAIVIRRAANLLGLLPAMPQVDSGFAHHPVLTTLHITPGLLFVLLGPLQFMPKLRNRRPRLHRVTGRVFIVCGLIVGVTALVMSPQMAIGGINEMAATILFAILFLFALVRAFLYIRRGNVALHREWMIRAFAIGLAVATIRPIMGVFFATRPLTHLAPHEFFGTAFWLGFTIQTIVAEIWINYTRPQRSRISPLRRDLAMRSSSE